MSNVSITTITFFGFEGLSARWQAFRQMGLSPGELKDIPGMTFGKMLGTGSGQGFRMWPDWGVYGLLQCWENEEAAQLFFAGNEWWQRLLHLSSERWTTYMHNARAHGRWEGKEPFPQSVEYLEDRPVGVLTRATIARRHLWHFWARVARVSRAIHEISEQPLFSVGVGELPVVQQATFSFWRNSHEMKAYAYKNPYHKEVVMRTHKEGWYSEELFARFHPYRSEGRWRGPHPLIDIL